MGTNDPAAVEQEYWTNIVPAHMEAVRVNNAISTLADQIYEGPIITDALRACGIEPTSRACWLAAAAAVQVLMAEDIGQTVRDDRGAQS